eukprot:CAMPEP_0194173872 /NCGR_PEP_ID=MMETSP0154-20130528/8135_1 /TAXON_ID=1049557 /ORGANISM="Thalassiothrix antarctica, Strain L6-D1" /LENGTH=195 /DNA_ID=CAMNT_0038887091 /DNA_START=423 /DNA_END=1010 /DNA_ORIENTATION=+
MAKTVIMDLMWLASQPQKASNNNNNDDNNNDIITIYIHSSGGSVVAGLAIHDVIKSMPVPVRTVCLGKAYSMAAILLSAGTKGYRHALPNSRIMIHQPSSSLRSMKASDVVIQTEFLLELKQKLENLLATYTKTSEIVLKAMMDRDTYMTSNDAQSIGIIDTIGPIPNLGIKNDNNNNTSTTDSNTAATTTASPS